MPINGPKSREQLQRIILSGHSVIHRGEVITHLHQLPSVVNLALGDPEKEAEVALSIDEQIAALEAQKAELEAAQQKREEESKEAAKEASQQLGRKEQQTVKDGAKKKEDEKNPDPKNDDDF